GAIWIGTFGGGLNRLDPRTRQITHYRHSPNDPTSLSDDLVWSVYVDRDGTLWIGTNAGVLNRFDRASRTFRHYHVGPPGSSYAIHVIRSDRTGALWVGT